MREPGFWWRKAGLPAALLAPVAAGYGAIAASRMARAGTRAGLPVLCVGNFTLGGAGKIPVLAQGQPDLFGHVDAAQLADLVDRRFEPHRRFRHLALRS